ncbi:MAG: hypothetical protein GY716_07420 [bacterium]|nr:hypothetical protein [bacterium]
MSQRVERLLASLWAGQLLAVAVLYLPGADEPGRIAREALILLLTPAALALTLAASRLLPPRALLGLLAAAASAATLGLLRTGSAEALVVGRDVLGLFALACAALGTAALPRSDSGDRQVFDGAVETAAGAALVALGGLGLLQGWLGWDGIAQVRSPAATFVNRNVAAQALVALVPLAVPPMLHARRRAKQWLCTTGVGLGLAFLIATRSRGAWIAVLVGAAIAVASRPAPRLRIPPSGRLRAAVPVLVLVGAALFLPVKSPETAMPSVGGALTSLGSPTGGSGAIRIALWRNTIGMIERRPWLGVGAGRFQVAYPTVHELRVPTPSFGVDTQPKHPHNDLLESAAEIGVLGTAPLAVAILAGFCFSFVRGRGNDAAAARARARAASIAGVLVHGLVSFPLHSPASAWILWLVVGRSWSAAGGKTGARGRLRAVPVVLLLGASALGAWVGVSEARAGREFGRLTREIRSGCRGAVESAARIQHGVPWDRDAMGRAGMAVFHCDADPATSLPALEAALLTHPNQINLLLATGARRLKAGDAGGAEEAFERAARILPRSPRGWLGVAMSHAASGKADAARRSCAAALRADPSFAPAIQFCSGR